MAESKLLWKYTPFAVEGHLRWFHNWATVNKAIDLRVPFCRQLGIFQVTIHSHVNITKSHEPDTPPLTLNK